MKIENQNPLQWNFSERAKGMQASFIREILKVTQQPEITSFAGGLPSPATFPVEIMQAAFDKVLSTNGKVALQYGPTDGYMPLRQWFANRTQLVAGGEEGHAQAALHRHFGQA